MNEVPKKGLFIAIAALARETRIFLDGEDITAKLCVTELAVRCDPADGLTKVQMTCEATVGVQAEGVELEITEVDWDAKAREVSEASLKSIHDGIEADGFAVTYGPCEKCGDHYSREGEVRRQGDKSIEACELKFAEESIQGVMPETPVFPLTRNTEKTPPIEAEQRPDALYSAVTRDAIDEFLFRHMFRPEDYWNYHGWPNALYSAVTRDAIDEFEAEAHPIESEPRCYNCNEPMKFPGGYTGGPIAIACELCKHTTVFNT